MIRYKCHVQNNDAEKSISITDNALHVTNTNNGLENIKKTEQAQPSVSQISNDNTVVRQASSTQQQPVVIVRQVQMPKTYSGNTSWKGYKEHFERIAAINGWVCLLYTSPSPRDRQKYRMPSSA